jgi:hypothetical protein
VKHKPPAGFSEAATNMRIPLVEERRRLLLLAEQNAKKVRKPGDRIRVRKCPGTLRWVTFAGWDGHWIVSKS